MILSLFKRNSLSTFAAMVFIGLLLWSFQYFFHDWQTYHHDQSPFFLWITGFLPTNTIFLTILAYVLLVVQALMINSIADKYKILRKKKMVPGLIYIMLMSINPTLMTVHPTLLANFFLIMAISISLGEVSPKKAALRAFNLGLLISLAGLLFFPAYILGFVVFLLRGLLSSGKARAFFASLLGFGAPFFFAANYYFHAGMLEERFGQVVQNFNNLGFNGFKAELFLALIFAYVGILVIISIGNLTFEPSNATTTVIRSRLTNIVIMFLFTLVSLLLSGNQWQMAACLVFAPTSKSIAIWLVEHKNKWIAESVILILLLLIFLSKTPGF